MSTHITPPSTRYCPNCVRHWPISRPRARRSRSSPPQSTRTVCNRTDLRRRGPDGRHPGNRCRSSQAVAAAGESHATFIEISPHPLLAHAITQTAPPAPPTTTASQPCRRDDYDTLTFHTNLNATHTTAPPTNPAPTRTRTVLPPPRGSTPTTGSTSRRRGKRAGSPDRKMTGTPSSRGGPPLDGPPLLLTGAPGCCSRSHRLPRTSLWRTSSRPRSTSCQRRWWPTILPDLPCGRRPGKRSQRAVRTGRLVCTVRRRSGLPTVQRGEKKLTAATATMASPPRLFMLTRGPPSPGPPGYARTRDPVGPGSLTHTSRTPKSGAA